MSQTSHTVPKPSRDPSSSAALKAPAANPSLHPRNRVNHPSTNPSSPNRFFGLSVTASLRNLFFNITRHSHPPKNAGVVLSYTTFVFLIITQLVLTNLALVRLHRNTFPPLTLDLQQIHEDQALTLKEAAYWITQLQPLDTDRPFHDQPIQDETFSGRYQAYRLPAAVIRTVQLSANERTASPQTYHCLIIQTKDHTWTLRHHEN